MKDRFKSLEKRGIIAPTAKSRRLVISSFHKFAPFMKASSIYTVTLLFADSFDRK